MQWMKFRCGEQQAAPISKQQHCSSVAAVVAAAISSLPIDFLPTAPTPPRTPSGPYHLVLACIVHERQRLRQSPPG